MLDLDLFDGTIYSLSKDVKKTLEVIFLLTTAHFFSPEAQWQARPHQENVT